MTVLLRNLGAVVLIGVTFAGCGGSGDDPLDTDYSKLRIAESRETPLEYARNVEQILRPLRNGLRIMTVGGPVMPAVTAPGSAMQSPRSDTTVQCSFWPESSCSPAFGRTFRDREGSRSVMDDGATDVGAIAQWRKPEGLAAPTPPASVPGEREAARSGNIGDSVTGHRREPRAARVRGKPDIFRNVRFTPQNI